VTVTATRTAAVTTPSQTHAPETPEDDSEEEPKEPEAEPKEEEPKENEEEPTETESEDNAEPKAEVTEHKGMQIVSTEGNFVFLYTLLSVAEKSHQMLLSHSKPVRRRLFPVIICMSVVNSPSPPLLASSWARRT
jgi:hypothetical protein